MEAQQQDSAEQVDSEDTPAGGRSHLQVGDPVCIERREFPWRLTRVQAIEGDVITTIAGIAYDLLTGARLDPVGTQSASEVLQVPTRERLDSLVVLAFLQELSELNPRHLSSQDREVLVPLARRFLAGREQRGRDRFLHQLILKEDSK